MVKISRTTVAWYPMRIAYGSQKRILEIKKFLDDNQITTFVPMEYRENFDEEGRHVTLCPAIESIIFVKTTQEILTELKQYNAPLFPLRYMMRYDIENENYEILYIPEKEMQNFMIVASVMDGSVMYLGDKDFSNKIGRKVRVVAGVFKGVEGTIYRVNKNKRVVIELSGIMSVAIACISPDYLEDI